MTTHPTTVVHHRGPSTVDGSQLMSVLTGLRRPSRNAKTGPMVQQHVLRTDMSPAKAQSCGADVATCGHCPLRPLAVRQTGLRMRCYVQTWRGEHSCWRHAVGLETDAAGAVAALRGKVLRLGCYGDPGALPLEQTLALVHASAGWTGYTAQWRWRPDLQPYCLASVQTPTELADAERLGWRCFYVVQGDAPMWGLWAKRRVIQCVHATHGTQCHDCQLCNGHRGVLEGRPHVWIGAH